METVQVYTFGTGFHGQLGLGEDVVEALTPRLVESHFKGFKAVKQIACGSDSVWQVLENGECYAWGMVEGSNYSSSHQVSRTEGKAVRQVSCSDSRVGILFDDGTAILLENSSSNKVLSPLPGEQHVIRKIAVGQYQVIGLTDAGDVITNEFMRFQNKHRCVLSRQYKIVDVVACNMYAAALTDKGELYTWGVGPLGHAGPKNPMQPQPELVGGALQGKRVVMVSCAREHMACVTDTGELYTWGLVMAKPHKLGHGHSTSAVVPNVPQRVEALQGKKVVYVSCGADHTACLLDTGRLYTFGLGKTGALGHDDTEDQEFPKIVRALQTRIVREVHCSATMTVAVVDAGVEQNAALLMNNIANMFRKENNCREIFNRQALRLDHFANHALKSNLADEKTKEEETEAKEKEGEEEPCTTSIGVNPNGVMELSEAEEEAMYYPDLRFICEKRQRKTKRTTSKAQSNGDQKDKQEDQNEEPVLMELLCHRVVIASRCPVWKPIINQYSHYHEEGQAEQVQSRQMLLDLFVRDIEFEVLLLLVDYFYSDRLSWNNADKTQRNKDEEKDKETEEEQDTKTTISDDDDVLLRKLMEVARRYQLKGLLDQCLLAWESKIMKNPYQQWHQTEEVRKKKQGGGEEKKDDKKNEKREFARKINEYVSQRSLEHLKRHKDVAKSLSLEPTEQAVLENALLEDDTRIERLKQQRTKEEDEKKINKEENHNDGFGLPWRLSYEELVANEPNFIVTKNYIDGIVNARKKMSTDAETTSKEEAEEEANEKEEQPAVSVPRSNDGWTIVVNTLSYDLQRYVNNADCADVVFFVEGQRLYAHKAILCARSSHFRALFTSGMKESTSGEIEIADISYETFLSLLMYFYTGYTNITEETVVELMMIANLYSALQLQEQCESFVEDGILVDNVTYLLEMAERFQTHHLRCVAMDYLLQYVKGKIDVTQLEGFSSLKPEILDEFRRGETYAANCEVIGPKTGFINKALHLRIAARDVFNFLATKGDEKWEVSIRILRGEEEKRAQQLIEEKKAKRREKMDQKERLIREAKGHPVPIAEQQDRQRVLEGEKEKQVGKDKEQMELKDEDKEKEIDEEQQKGQEDQPETDLTNEKEKKAESEKFGSKGFEFAFKPTDGKDISQNASLPPPFSLPSPSKALTAAFPSSSSSSSPSSALFSRPKQNVNDKSAVSKRRIYSARRHKASASSSLPSSSNRTTPTTTSPSASASPSQETIEDGLHEVDNRPLSNDTYEPSAVLLTKNNPIVNDGYYTLSFTPRFIGIHELSIRLFEKPDTVREGANAQGAWKHVKGSPFPLVVEKPVCGCKCKAFFTVNGQRQCTVRAGKEVNVTIEAHGLNGERVTVGRSIFAVYVYMDEWEAYQAKNHGVADVQIKDYKDGTYKGTFKLRGAGDYVVRVTHGKITLTTYPTYSVTPQKEKHYPLPGVLDLRCVPAPPFAPKCSACGDGLQVGVIGQPATFTIHARDKYDNKPEGWQELRVRVRLLLNKRYPSFIPLRTVEQSVLAQVAEEKQKKEQEEAQKKKDEEERRKRKEEEDKRRGDQRRGISDQEQRKRKKAEAAESRFNYLKGIAKSKKEKSDKRKEQLAAWEEEVKRHTIAEWDVITTCNQDIIYVPPENILELIDTKKNQLAEEAQKIKEERAAEEAKTVLTNEDKEKTEESTEKLTTATNTSSGSAAQSDTTEEKREAVQAEAEVEEKQSEDEPIHCVLSVSILDANGEDQGPIQDSPFSLLLFKPEQTTQFLAFQQQQKRQQQKLFTVTAPSFAFSSSSTSSSTSPRPLGLSTSFSSISSSPSLFSSSALTASSPSLPTSTPMFASPPLSSSSSSFTSPFYSPSFASPFTSGTLPSSIASPPIPPAGNTARPFASTSPFFSGTTASITPQQPTNQPFSFFAPSSSSSLSSAPFSFSSPSSASSLPTPSSSFTLPLSTPSSSSLSPVAPPFAFPILSPPSSSASVAVGVLPTTTTDSDGDDSSTESNHNHQQQP